MAQGAVEKSVKPAFGSKSKQHAPKRDGRVAKPQKAKKTSTTKIAKKFSSGLIGKTEAMLGERAGHLELIGKGRNKKGGKTDAAAKTKGGTRKFG